MVAQAAAASRILRLPEAGRLLVCTDIQGNLRDFRRMVDIFEAAPEPCWLVFTGDLVHGPDPETEQHWPEHLGTPYTDRSPEVVRLYRELLERHPGRVHCLLGNHEHAHVGGPPVSKFYLDESRALEDRVGPEEAALLRETFRGFPLVAVAPNGVVLTHAAPGAVIDSPGDLERVSITGYENMQARTFMQVPVLGPLLWSRWAPLDRSSRFLGALGGRVCVFGHDVVREGFEREAPDQLCVSTSFGLLDARKVYVDIDLSREYSSSNDFVVGREIRPLW